ncbi:hypothetical protein [Lentzea sp.]|uniref:hypothetical protein n=1 Tax=Lentzea sp. TaxID=56099 RepID=UPI002B9636BF|nr:hypothetical protein [Lentzea sp.]HUQ56116.1 hypothetical protein [Lentzea sp.]
MTTELGDMSSRQLQATALETLDNAVCAALANVEDSREALSEALAACAATGADVPPQIGACVAAADEHVRYGEWREARMLLTVAHRLLARASWPMIVPTPSTPGDVVLGR